MSMSLLSLRSPRSGEETAIHTPPTPPPWTPTSTPPRMTTPTSTTTTTTITTTTTTTTSIARWTSPGSIRAATILFLMLSHDYYLIGSFIRMYLIFLFIYLLKTLSLYHVMYYLLVYVCMNRSICMYLWHFPSFKLFLLLFSPVRRYCRLYRTMGVINLFPILLTIIFLKHYFFSFLCFFLPLTRM